MAESENAVGGTNCSGMVKSAGYNLDSGNTCGFNATGDLHDANPILGDLALNGVTIQTHALLPGSPAINSGAPSGCPATDERGVARPQGPRCDMGAFELTQNATPTPTTATPPTDTPTTIAMPTATATAMPTATLTDTAMPTATTTAMSTPTATSTVLAQPNMTTAPATMTMTALPSTATPTATTLPDTPTPPLLVPSQNHVLLPLIIK